MTLRLVVAVSALLGGVLPANAHRGDTTGGCSAAPTGEAAKLPAERRPHRTITPKTAKYRRFVALVRASEKGDIEAVRMLIERGVDVNGRDAGDGLAPIDRPIVRASAKGHLEIVDFLLASGANPNWCCCSCVAPLHEAIRGRHTRVVARLLEAGANPQLLYDASKSPLELARESGDPEIVALVERRLTRR
jgi:ankyrin repeat protein